MKKSVIHFLVSETKSAEATGPGVLGVSSGTLHLILLPAVRKFGTTRFFAFYLLFRPSPLTPRPFLAVWSSCPPPPAPHLFSALPLPHFCICSALSRYRSKSMSSVTVLVSAKPSIKIKQKTPNYLFNKFYFLFAY